MGEFVGINPAKARSLLLGMRDLNDRVAVLRTELAAFERSLAVPRAELLTLRSLRLAALRFRVAAAFLAAALRCALVRVATCLLSS